MAENEELVWPFWMDDEITLYNPRLEKGLLPIKPDFNVEAVPGTLRSEMGTVLKIIVRNYPYLSMKHIKGNPRDGQFGVMFCESDTSSHEYEIYSQGNPIGMYYFVIELIDGDTEYKSILPGLSG
jgi:hypothetical protein